MVKNKSKTTVFEPQKMVTMEEKKCEVDHKLSDLRSEMYESQQQTQALMDQRLATFAQRV